MLAHITIYGYIWIRQYGSVLYMWASMKFLPINNACDSFNIAACFQNKTNCVCKAYVSTFLGFVQTFLILSRFLGLGVHVGDVTLLTVTTAPRLAALPSPTTPVWGE